MNDVLEILYISENVFWDTIDVAIKKITKNETIVFVRICGEPPCDFEDTWNYEQGLGPFKLMYAVRIDIEDYN